MILRAFEPEYDEPTEPDYTRSVEISGIPSDAEIHTTEIVHGPMTYVLVQIRESQPIDQHPFGAGVIGEKFDAERGLEGFDPKHN